MRRAIPRRSNRSSVVWFKGYRTTPGYYAIKVAGSSPNDAGSGTHLVTDRMEKTPESG